MHLGLIDRSFVPHNLIPTEESPVPLLQFQMAPRLKILIAFGSKKEPRYTLLVSQKSWQTNHLQVPQQGSYGEGGLPTVHFVYLLKTSSFGSPVKEPPLQVLLWSLCRVVPHHYSPATYLPGSSVKELPLPDPLHGASSRREMLHPQSPLYHLSNSPVDEPSSSFPKRGPYGRRCPSPEPFFHMSYRVPSKGGLTQVPLTELPQRETLHP